MKFNQSEQSDQHNQQASGLPQSNLVSTGQNTNSETNNGAQNDAQGLINLPKGGGAIQGIGEKFETNPVTGTFSMSAPLAISPGRNGFGPQLGLSYNSGGGNSVFGVGWGIGIPNITRNTDKGLPQYDDIHDSDTFILSGAEDLVPADDALRTVGDYSIKRYLPRTEGLFAQIEKWHNITTDEVHWRTISKENVTSIYGRDVTARIAHPDDATKIFSWYLQLSYDVRGNLMQYTYKQEDPINVPSDVNELHRKDNDKAFTNIYPDQVRYGNTTMFDPATESYNGDWHFALAFDYGNYGSFTTSGDTVTPTSQWDVRQDPFSVYRAGFEMRTYRLCHRVLMFHYFTNDLGDDAVLVKSTELTYAKDAHMAQLTSVAHKAHDGVDEATMPPLTFSYSKAQMGSKLHSVEPEQLEHLPNGLATTGWQWADLHGEGISSLLKTGNNAWYYKPNLGDARWTGDPSVDPKPVFGKLKQIDLKPNAKQGAGTSFYLGDVDSNSQPELVVNGPGAQGYYSFEDGEWQNFRPFENMPNIDMSDPNIKQIDATGDGLADLLISRGTYFELYLSAGKEGYKAYRKIEVGHDDELGPVVLFSDAERSIHLADMCGDGLSDIVRITHNSVCYWPNMGYGHFGEKVVMRNIPLMDTPDQYNPARVKLADVDGTGTTDIIYLGADKVCYYKNQAGNAWSNEQTISAFPAIDNLSQVSVTDLMGNGTSCLVWSSSLPTQRHQLKFVELTSGIKPYLLTNFENGLGRKVSLQYAPSTKFFMQDKTAGKDWITRLPFPVQVLERVEDHELVSDTKITSRYAYHHGHYDVHEREFRGFGMVEQWDTEDLADTESYQPPVYTKSWFHTGVYDKRDSLARQFATEYFNGDAEAWQLPDTKLPDGLTPDEEREACRALRGQLLRSEVYAEDGTPQASLPYLVEEKNMAVKLLQTKGDNKHAVFLPIGNEAFSYHYERNANDPRIAHSITLNTDDYGNVLDAFQIAYPRRDVAGATVEQKELTVVYTQTNYIDPADNIAQLIGIPYESKQYEMGGFKATGQPITKEELQTALDEAKEIDYTTPLSGNVEKRCFQHQKSFFYDEGLTGSLPLGEIATHAIPYKSLTADLTEDILAQVDGDGTKYTIERLGSDAAYVFEPGVNGRQGVWWIPSAVMAFDPLSFYLPTAQTDAFGNSTQMAYDAYDIMLNSTTDALGHSSMVEIDYRLLQVKKLTDPNGNSQAVAFDTRGMVKAVALMGANGEGDTLEKPTMQYSYDLDRWVNTQQPAQGHVRMRVEHGNDASELMESYEYTGGWGNLVMTKVQAEDGEAMQIAEDGTKEVVSTTNRWVGNGRTVFNNKGKVVRQYEPYFSTTHEYEAEKDLTTHGVSPVLFYDPVGRNMRTELPDGTLTKVEFTPWEQRNFDQNDSVLESQWYTDMGSPDPLGAEPSDAQQRAAWLTAKHANTPQVRYFDNMGREYMVEDDNGSEGKYRVHTQLDIAGRSAVVTDAKGRAMTTNTFGMQQALQVHNIDSGTRTLLNDVSGQSLYSWDSRSHQVRLTYDALRRPLATYLKEGAANEIKVQEQQYGTSALANNIGQLEYQYDQSGRTHVVSYDFKGNPEETRKAFWEDFIGYRNLNTLPALQTQGDPETIVEYTTSIVVDALNRPISKTLPDGTTETYLYNKAGLLEGLTSGGKLYVSNINYNEKGQRTDIYYANNTKTRYIYDDKTFRLERLLTTRNNGQDILQDLNYIFDAVGNIVEQVDAAQTTFYFSNQEIPPKGKYEYDALYRLLKATGRELDSLAMPTASDFANNIGLPNTASNAMQNYTHTYSYDELGNMQTVNSQGNWSRDYFYNTNNNYLLGHTDGATEYTYDTHGNMLTMPHLHSMRWDYLDQLTGVSLSVCNNSTINEDDKPDDCQTDCTLQGDERNCNNIHRAYYIYNSAGERVRKVIEKGITREECYYFGDYEIYHKFVNDVLETERTTVNVSDDKKKIATAETLTVHQGSLTNNTDAIIRYQYDNHLGSASLELDDNGAIISYEEYHPFGTTSYRSGRSETETSQKRYKYVGKERDEETGLYYYGYKYYAAWLCRFVSVDPLQFEYPQLTPYNYAGNKPVTHIDIDGLQGTGDEKLGFGTTSLIGRIPPKRPLASPSGIPLSVRFASFYKRHKEVIKTSLALAAAIGMFAGGIALSATGVGVGLGAAMIIGGAGAIGLAGAQLGLALTTEKEERTDEQKDIMSYGNYGDMIGHQIEKETGVNGIRDAAYYSFAAFEIYAGSTSALKTLPRTSEKFLINSGRLNTSLRNGNLIQTTADLARVTYYASKGMSKVARLLSAPNEYFRIAMEAYIDSKFADDTRVRHLDIWDNLIINEEEGVISLKYSAKIIIDGINEENFYIESTFNAEDFESGEVNIIEELNLNIKQ